MRDDTGRDDPIPYASPPPPSAPPRRAPFVTVAFLFAAGYFFALLFAFGLGVAAHDAFSPYDWRAVVTKHISKGMLTVLAFPAFTLAQRHSLVGVGLWLFALNLLAWGLIPAVLLRIVQRRRASR